MAAQLSVEMTGDERKLAKKLVRAEANIDSLKRKLREAGKAGKRSGSEISGSMKSIKMSMGALAGAAGLGSVQQALSAINASYQTWLRNQREISLEVQKSTRSSVAFSALQPVGMKQSRKREAIQLGMYYGLEEDRDGITGTVQALQSARGGSFKAGMDTAKTVFAATQVGISMDRARELEVIGASQGMASGQALRFAFVAGQESARDPEVLAGASPGLSFFEDKVFGISAAGVLAGSQKPEELGTFLKAAGIALSKNSSVGFQDTFKELGVENATRLEKLQALAAAGINTQEELGLAGLTEMRQQQALVGLINNIPDVFRIMSGVEQRAKPGLFAEQRAKIEAEDPLAKKERELRVLQAMHKYEQTFGAGAVGALDLEISQTARGLANRRMGREQAGPIDLIDEQGRASIYSGVTAFLSSFSAAGLLGSESTGLDALSDQLDRIGNELEDINRNTLSSAENGGRATERRPRINPDAQNE
ncbi:MAG: hypothetical protein ACPGXK_00235 [Phycisphaerae bacterium]